MTSLNSRQLYRRLLVYAQPHWRIFLLCIASMVVYAATDPILPALLKPFLDGSFLSARSTRALIFPVLIVLLFIVRGALNYVSTVSLNWVSQRVMTDLRNDMFRKLVRLPTRFYDGSSAGELISRLTFDVTQVQDANTRVLMVLVKDTLSIIALVSYMCYVHWRLAIVVILLAPVIAFVVRRISSRLREMSRRVQRSMGAITHVAEEAIEGHKVVKIFGGQGYEVTRFEQATNNARKYAMKVVMTSAANEPVILVIIAVGIAIMIYSASLMSASRLMTPGEFVAFFTALSLVLAPVRRITAINEPLQRGLAAAESIFSLIDEGTEPDSGSRSLGRCRGEIRFENVGFTYPLANEAALKEISLTIAAGETVALVGASGSGKTTLAGLVPRFYRPSTGTIRIDGFDLDEVALTSLRENIALVSQDVVLFNDTLRNNIAYGGQNGVRLSGGQRQRLAIARALLKDAPVLILDEATSALDTVSERHIQEALELLRKGRTCLIIAHRLSTIQNADRIIVMREGRVVETGTHEQLVARGGVYSTLYRVQYAAEAEAREQLAT